MLDSVRSLFHIDMGSHFCSLNYFINEPLNFNADSAHCAVVLTFDGHAYVNLLSTRLITDLVKKGFLKKIKIIAAQEQK